MTADQRPDTGDWRPGIGLRQSLISNLQSPIFALTVLPLTVLLLVITFGSLTLHQRAMRTLVGERDQRAARAAAAAISEQLNHRAAAMRGLALRSGAASPDGVLAGSAFLLPDFDGGLALFARDGTLLAASGQPETWQVRPAAELAARTAGSEGAVQFSAPFTDPASGERMVLVAAATPEGSTAMGAFFPASLARRALGDAFAASEQAAAYLADADGQMLYHAGALLQLTTDLARHPGVADALRGESGATYISTANGEHVVAFSPVSPVDWALVVEEPWGAVSNPWLRTTQAAPLILIPALLFALVALWFGARQIVRPLQVLARQATDLAWGRFEAIERPVGGIAEIRRLQAELIHMARKLKAAQQGLHGYVGAITAGQEDERRRLARELHDDTVQSLIALNQRVQLAQLALDGQPSDGAQDRPAADALADVHQLTGEIIEDVRRFTRALRPIYLEDLGLAPALEVLAGEMADTAGISIDFTLSGLARRLSPEVELALYRMAQEALSNVARHARASRASVRLAFERDALTLTVEDDGQGFEVPESPTEFAPRGHFGLLGLHERAELIGARLEIRSAPGQRSHLTISVPVAAEVQASTSVKVQKEN